MTLAPRPPSSGPWPALAAALVCGAAVSPLLGRAAQAAALLASLAALATLVRLPAGRRATPLVVLGGLALGLVRGTPPPRPPRLLDPPVLRVCGRLAGALLPSPSPRGRVRSRRVALRDVRILPDGEGAGGSFPLLGGADLLVPPSDRFLPRGTVVRATVRARPPRRPRNPGETVSRRAARLLLRVDDARALEVVAPPPHASPAAALDRLRCRILRRARLALDGATAELALALVLGVRDGLAADLLEAVRTTGTAHLLAISGFHVGCLVLALRGILGLFLPPRPADALALAVALFHAGVAGAGTPVLRASIGCALFLFGRVLGRTPSPFAVLSATAAALTLADPAEPRRAGFQLTFAATSALLFLHRRPSRGGGLLAPLVRTTRASLACAAATCALLVHHFGRFGWAGFLLQMLVLPAFLSAYALSLILLAALAFLPPSHPAVTWLSLPASAALTAFAGSVSLLARLPGLVAAPQRPGALWAVLLTLAFLDVLRRPSRPRARGAVALLALFVHLSIAARRPPAAPELWLFDVGHGQAALLRTQEGRNVLFDAGSLGRGDVGRRVLLPGLDAVGSPFLDLLVLSHPDADHVDGAFDLVASGRVGRVAIPAWSHPFHERLARLCAREHVPLDRVAAGEDLSPWPELRLLVVSPDGNEPARTDNDQSLVVRAALAGGGVVLLPGDVQERALRRLLRRPGATRRAGADVLVLPHHGNPCPPLFGLLLRCAPRLALASRAGPLAPEVRAVLARAGVPVATTAECGALRVRLRPGSPRCIPRPRTGIPVAAPLPRAAGSP